MLTRTLRPETPVTPDPSPSAARGPPLERAPAPRGARQDLDKSGYIDEQELEKAAKKLGFPFASKAELKAKFIEIDKDGNGRIS
eukprot:373874-Prymnesium_polylepis.1